MNNPILEKLAAKSNFAEIQIKPFDMSAQQDQMLEYLTAKCTRNFVSRADSILSTVIQERIQNKSMPLALRKKILYENALQKQAEKNLLIDEDETTAIVNTAETRFIPIIMRKRLMYERARAG